VVEVVDEVEAVVVVEEQLLGFRPIAAFSTPSASVAVTSQPPGHRSTQNSWPRDGVTKKKMPTIVGARYFMDSSVARDRPALCNPDDSAHDENGKARGYALGPSTEPGVSVKTTPNKRTLHGRDVPPKTPKSESEPELVMDTARTFRGHAR
jgi:hypothetical protein